MKKVTAAILLSLFIFAACSSDPNNSFVNWMQPNGKVKVLCTIEMIQDVVKQVGAEHVDTLALITGDLDPHAYQLVKGDDEKLAFAHLIFANGLELEHGPSLREYLHTAPKVVFLGDRLHREEPGLILLENGSLDPHIWMDISMWAKTVPYVVQALSDQDPAHAEQYRDNGRKLQKKMLIAHQQVKRMLHEVPDERRYLVTSHDAFNYFARAYLASDHEKTQSDWRNRFAAPEGLAPESQLSVTDIQNIIDHLKKYRIQVLFPESNVSQDSIRKIENAGRENGLHLQIAKEPLYGDTMGCPGSSAESYLQMIHHNADTIATYLKNGYEQTGT